MEKLERKTGTVKLKTGNGCQIVLMIIILIYGLARLD